MTASWTWLQGVITANGQVFDLPVLSPFAQAIVTAGGVIPYIQKFGFLTRRKTGGLTIASTMCHPRRWYRS